MVISRAECGSSRPFPLIFPGRARGRPKSTGTNFHEKRRPNHHARSFPWMNGAARKLPQPDSSYSWSCLAEEKVRLPNNRAKFHRPSFQQRCRLRVRLAQARTGVQMMTWGAGIRSMPSRPAGFAPAIHSSSAFTVANQTTILAL